MFKKLDVKSSEPEEDKQHSSGGMNIADDYFKAKKQVEMAGGRAFRRRIRSLYDLKHELINAQIKLENPGEGCGSTSKERTRSFRKQVVRLEAEMRRIGTGNKCRGCCMRLRVTAFPFTFSLQQVEAAFCGVKTVDEKIDAEVTGAGRVF